MFVSEQRASLRFRPHMKPASPTVVQTLVPVRAVPTLLLLMLVIMQDKEHRADRYDDREKQEDEYDGYYLHVRDTL